MSDTQLQEVLDRHPDAGRESLIPILQEVQDAVGFLSREAIVSIGRRLGLPASKIYGVATFYSQFRFRGLGRYHIQVCRGTACHVKGSAAVLEAIQRELAIEPGQTARDGVFSLEVVSCIGACGMSPVMAVNGEFFAGLTPETAVGIIEAFRRLDSEQRKTDHDEQSDGQ